MSEMRVADLGEDTVIAKLTAHCTTDSSVLLGIGDDCAVVQGPPVGKVQLLKTDAVVQDVHFLLNADPEAVGWKAMARVVSDIAAMGGVPRHALVTLMLPVQTCMIYAQGLYRGLQRCADHFSISIVGGETTRGPLVMLSVAMTGEVDAQHYAVRHRVQIGDLMVVTGRLGGSIQGHHLNFIPRLAEGQWLARQPGVHAMMDLSDGLQKDVQRLCQRSAPLAYELDTTALPLNPGCSVQQGLKDGEDYELLLAVDASSWDALSQAWQQQFPETLLSCVGTFVSITEDVAEKGGWDHFQP